MKKVFFTVLFSFICFCGFCDGLTFKVPDGVYASYIWRDENFKKARANGQNVIKILMDKPENFPIYCSESYGAENYGLPGEKFTSEIVSGQFDLEDLNLWSEHTSQQPVIIRGKRYGSWFFDNYPEENSADPIGNFEAVIAIDDAIYVIYFQMADENEEIEEALSEYVYRTNGEFLTKWRFKSKEARQKVLDLIETRSKKLPPKLLQFCKEWDEFLASLDIVELKPAQ